jgi:hypothetical protein
MFPVCKLRLRSIFLVLTLLGFYHITCTTSSTFHYLIFPLVSIQLQWYRPHHSFWRFNSSPPHHNRSATPQTHQDPNLEGKPSAHFPDNSLISRTSSDLFPVPVIFHPADRNRCHYPSCQS